MGAGTNDVVTAMPRIAHLTAIVIGGGPAGLATSRRLAERSVDHVVLERGRPAERWRSERWDSLRLLTPNWQTRLPGWRYRGADPDGYMTMPEIVEYLDDYAESFDAPILAHTEVKSLRPSFDGFFVETEQGWYSADAVVIATGLTPSIPSLQRGFAPSVSQIHSSRYKSPAALPGGGVLVVGASASGLQIAHELRSAGRDVVLSVGEHVRLPRTYRNRDIHWWLDLAGTLDSTISQVPDLERARRSPSLQLVGTPDHRTLDLDTLVATGVDLAGRTRFAKGWTVGFHDDLPVTTARADRRMARLLDLFDHVATAAALDDRVGPPHRPAPMIASPGPDSIDLDASGISTVLWATGFRPHHPWLDLPVFDDRGEIAHHGGVTAWPGLYTMGLPFMRRRKSTFLDGFGADAEDIVDHLMEHLDTRTRARRWLLTR